MHGSNTDVGGVADVKINDLFTYVLHQAAVSTLDPENTLVHDISYSPRARTSMQCASDLKDMFLNDDVSTWGDTENAMDIPDIYLGMCGIIATVGSLVLEDQTMIDIAQYAADNVMYVCFTDPFLLILPTCSIKPGQKVMKFVIVPVGKSKTDFCLLRNT